MGLSANSPPQSKKKSMKRDMQIKIIQRETKRKKNKAKYMNCRSISNIHY